MPWFVHILPVSAVQKLLKSIKIWQSCSQMYTATFYEPRQKCTFWYFQVSCGHKSGNVINFIIFACRIFSRLKRYKNYKNRLRLAKVIVNNKMSHFYGSLCSVFTNDMKWCVNWPIKMMCKADTDNWLLQQHACQGASVITLKLQCLNTQNMSSKDTTP